MRSNPKTGKRLAGAAAFSIVTVAAATGVLASAAPASAAEPTQVVVGSPFLKTTLSSFDQTIAGAFHKVESSSFLKLT
jgi:hypothetical protein